MSFLIYTPNKHLTIAASRGLDDEVDIALYSRRADPNACDADGTPALSLAALKGHSKAWKLILRNNANIDKPDAFGNTPIMNAIIYFSTKAFAGLWERGANLNIPNSAGLTARDLVAEVTDECPQIKWIYDQILAHEQAPNRPARRPQLVVYAL